MFRSRSCSKAFRLATTLRVCTSQPGDSGNSRCTAKADDIRSGSDERRVLQGVTEIAA